MREPIARRHCGLPRPLDIQRAHAQVETAVATTEAVFDDPGFQHQARPDRSQLRIKPLAQPVNAAVANIVVDKGDRLPGEQQQVQIYAAAAGGRLVGFAEIIADLRAAERGAAIDRALPASPGDLYAGLVQVPTRIAVAAGRPFGPVTQERASPASARRRPQRSML